MIRLSILIALFLVFPLKAATYTLADLEILAQEGSSEEFFKHALDVRPSERLDAWKSMVSKMGEVFAGSVLNKIVIEEKNFKKTEELFRWPVLRVDDVFKLRRQEIGLRYLRHCLKDTNPCLAAIKSFWESDNTDPEIAIKLAEMTLPLNSTEFTSWTFLEVALKSPLSEFYCKKDFAMKALWGKLELDYVRLGPKGDLLKKIDQTIHPDCLPGLNRAAMEKLFSPSKVGDREVAYQILKVQNKMNSKITDFFYTVYLLENPSRGELFNYAWTRLGDLGKANEKRMAVMGDLKNLDPLPDAIFSSLDLAKKKVILNHFKQNFPEYLDYYANQCTLYYGGKQSFPQGNPTIHCQDLMNSELAAPFLGKEKVDEYNRVRKI